MGDGWTIDTLRDHFEALLAAHELMDVQRLRMAEQETRQAVDASQHAVTKAEQASVTFLPRAEADVQLQAIKAWDGHLPAQMIPGGAVPFINLSK